jgi:uncharacterized membrane protein
VDPLVCVASFGIVSIPVVAVGYALLPPVGWHYAMKAMVAGLLFMGAAWLYYDTVAQEDISRVAPLLCLSTVQTLMLSIFFLNEALSAHQCFAVFIMVMSSLLLALRTGSHGRIKIGLILFRIIPVTTLLSVEEVLMAQVYRGTSIWQAEVWHSLGLIVGLLPAILFLSAQHRVRWCNVSGRTWGILFVEQITRFFTSFIAAWALMQGAPVAILSALSGVQLLWVWLFAYVLLKERTRGWELMARSGGMIGMVLGIYWMT